MPTAFGSLRDAVANANTGDTISLEALPAECKSTITLTNGAIGISQPDLMIKGPADRVDILYAGAGYDRLFNHSGTGTLELDHVNIAFGRPKGSLEPVFGGCIYSKGSVTLSHSGVYSCVADAPATFAGGGAIAANSVTLNYSAIDSNKVESGTTAAGGGIYVRGGTFISKYSRIDHNTLDTFGHGGGVAAYGNVIVAHSTISGNHAKGQVGGLRAHAQSGGLLVIAESTISGNSSESYVGGVDSDVASATIQNSTIAFNTAAKGKLLDGEHQAPGLNVQFGSVTLQSSLLAHNTYGAVENDFAAPQGVTVSGADNFIGASDSSLPSSGLVFGKCANLGPLRDNGGPVQTHALLSGSDALDKGNNDTNIPFDAQPYDYDQRGAPFQRIQGARADIGAHETDQNDIVFNTAFDGC